MSKTTAALEVAVATVIENTPKDGGPSSARQRAAVDRAFAHILKLIAPRIRHFARQYGLMAHWEDAEQCCAIAVHRAIQAYEPEKAQFTTFVNWQIRGELQSLRFRLMTDQRPSAKKVDATTVSLHATGIGADGEETSLEALIEDEDALARTESIAADFMAQNATSALVAEYARLARKQGVEQLRKRPRPRSAVTVPTEGPRLRSRNHGVDPVELEKLDQKIARDRAIIEARVFELPGSDLVDDAGLTKERVRQIVRRSTKTLAEIAASTPRFSGMAEYRKPRAVQPRPQRAAGLLPDADAPHNRMARVAAVTPQALSTAGNSVLDLDSAHANDGFAAANGLASLAIH